MRSVEKSARTIEEAIDEAIDELGVERSRVDVEVLEEGNKGFLGIIGGRLARVRVTAKDEREEKIKVGMEFLKGLLELLEIPADLTQNEAADGAVQFDIAGEQLGLIIGRRGQTLDAVQYLVNLVANKGDGEWIRFMLDAAGYREKRDMALEELARRMAGRVKKQRRRAVLEPMNARERRIVHMALADDTSVATHSEGEEPYRRIVITPRRG